MPRFYETTLSITNLHNLSISTHVNRSRINTNVLKRNHIDNFYQLWTKSLKVPKTMFVLVMVLMTNMFKKCCLNMPKRERQKY